jgi:general stress protein YciG
MPWRWKRDGTVDYIERDGCGGWIEVPPKYWPDPPPARLGAVAPRPDSAGPTFKPPTPSAVRQFMREIGRRGGHERCRNHARRTSRGWIRFGRRYECDPSQVIAAPVTASQEVWHHLRAFASRGGRSRAQKYPREQLRAWAAKGGRAKAEKFRRASLPAQDVAGKQK